MTATKERIAIITRRDSYANGVKPRHLKDFLESSGYQVDEYNSVGLGRHVHQGFGVSVPQFSYDAIRLFWYELLWALVRITLRFVRLAALRSAQGHLLRRIIRLRGRIFADRLSDGGYLAAICASSQDQAVFLGRRIADLQVLALTVPWADELYYGGELSDGTYKELTSLERVCYAAADRLSFDWHTYVDFVKRNSYRGGNWLDCTYGVSEKRKRATFAAPPRIIFLGNLEGYWVNLPLLRHLCRICPELDVWGGPDPGPNSGLNYRGYAPDLDVMADYQFGLITITDDPLRRSSFSSKHLEYASYGLPVLTPCWRQDEILGPSSIYYGRDTFLEVLAEYSREDSWSVKSQQSLAVAETLSWTTAFRDLGEMIEGMRGRS
jgi:hypothetical protein